MGSGTTTYQFTKHTSAGRARTLAVSQRKRQLPVQYRTICGYQRRRNGRACGELKIRSKSVYYIVYSNYLFFVFL